MAIELIGGPVSKKIKLDTKEKLEYLKSRGKRVKLATVRLGENSDDITYEKNIIRNCEKAGIEIVNIRKPENISTEELLDVLNELNNDNDVYGILMLSLLTTREDQEIIRQAIDIDKDIDAIHPVNLEKVFRGELEGFAPCAAMAAVEILDYYEVDTKWKSVVIVNRSMVIGKPLGMMMLAKDATITICHTKTNGLKEVMKNADIVLTAIGEAKYFDKSYFNKDSIIIDIGIDFDKDGHLSGDVDYDDVFDHVSMITPVPGGLGGVTTSILLNHTVSSAYEMLKLEEVYN